MPGDLDYVSSLEEIGWGLTLIALTIVIHAVGTTLAIFATEGPDDLRIQDRFGVGLLRVIVMGLLLVTLHLVEVFVWAFFFHWQGCFPTLSMSYNVALLDYTTLGSDYSLPSRWRLLEGMIAICGLLTFAWTTSVLLGLIQQIQARRTARHPKAPAGGDRSSLP